MLEDAHDNGDSYRRPNKAPKLGAPRSDTRPGHGSQPTFPGSPRWWRNLAIFEPPWQQARQRQRHGESKPWITLPCGAGAPSFGSVRPTSRGSAPVDPKAPCTGAGGPRSRGYEHPDTREHLPRFRNLGQLEGDVAAVADVYGADLDQLLDAGAIRRPAFLPQAYGEVLERSKRAVSNSPLAVPRRSVI
jgi:hypothetical protein